MKKILATSAAALLALGGSLSLANAATPLAKQACANDSCSVNFTRDVQQNHVPAGSPATAKYAFAQGVTEVPLALFAVTFKKTDSLDPVDATGLEKLGQDVKTDGSGLITLPTTKDMTGSVIIVAPADLTLDLLKSKDFIPVAAGVGNQKVSTSYLLSDKARDVGINIGVDFMTLHESATVDVSALSKPTTVFGTSVKYGHKGDVYNVELLRDGKWVKIGRTGVGTAGVSYDEARTIKGIAGGHASIAWRLPEDLAPGQYKVRAFNETKNVPGDIERTVTVTGTAAPKPSDPGPSAPADDDLPGDDQQPTSGPTPPAVAPLPPKTGH